ncbi:ankyrin repeat domain-containing protein [Aspergillus mulundensis]|uniref:Uncharacterized protein n=1 Tax=Aspergillus mulundensis TaxID=1810919 RepID=A0A3D8R044_9EURO|nr:hypothetical protein DSM5745_09285 [Aspergillus mulundensis]RDW67419.1 hypothetical protein DSM5745_09285 [Aspergillus mulundensis]
MPRTLPLEIYTIINSFLPTLRSKTRLLRTCRTLYTLLARRLYREFLASSTQPDILKTLNSIAEKDNCSALRRFLDAGAPACTTVQSSSSNAPHTVCEILGDAVRNGSEHMVRLLLEGKDRYGIDVNAMDAVNGYSCFGTAVLRGMQGMVGMMLDAGADPNGFTRPDVDDSRWAEEYKRERILVKAVGAGRGSNGVVAMLLNAGADPAMESRKGQSALAMAAWDGNTEVVLWILRILERREGFDMRGFVNRGPRAPLLGAVSLVSPPFVPVAGACDIRAIRLLLKHGASLDCQDEYWGTVLTAALERGDPDILDLLVAHGLSLTDPPARNTGRRGYDVLTLAVIGGSPEIVRRMLDAGLPVKPPAVCKGLTAAVVRGQTEILKILIEAGADIEGSPALSETPLYSSLFYGNPDVITTLLDNGARAPTPSEIESGRLLRRVAESGDAYVMRMLLHWGADPCVGTRHGQTPLCLAAIHGRPGVAAELLSDRTAMETWTRDGKLVPGPVLDRGMGERGHWPSQVDRIDLADEKGRTPLYHATVNGFVDIVRMLLACGSNAASARTICDLTAIEAANRTRAAAFEQNDNTMEEIYQLLCDPDTAMLDNDVVKTAFAQCDKYRYDRVCEVCSCPLSRFGGWYVCWERCCIIEQCCAECAPEEDNDHLEVVQYGDIPRLDSRI